MEGLNLSKMERDYLEALVEDDMFLCTSYPGDNHPEAFARMQDTLVSLVRRGLTVVFGNPEPPVPFTPEQSKAWRRAAREGTLKPDPGKLVDLAPDEAEAVLRCADNWTNPRAPSWMIRSTPKGAALLAAE